MTRKIKRLLLWVGTPLATFLLILSVLFAAWLNGTRIPLASGATYLKVTKTGEASFNGEPTQPTFILIVGNDYRPGVEGRRGDAIHLIGINPELKQGTILNFPRDTEVAIPGNGTNKINAANAFGGARLSAETVGNLVGVSVPYVIEADFGQFVSLINAIGGVEINVTRPMRDSNSGTSFDPGLLKLDGNQALAFSRDRYSFPSGDIARTQNQGEVILAGFKAFRAGDGSIANKFTTLSTLMRHTSLDGLGVNDLFSLESLASQIDPGNVRNVTVPVQNVGRGSNLSPTAEAQAIFADFRDDAVLQSR